MRRLEFQKECLKIYSTKEVPLLDDTKYIISQVENRSRKRGIELLKRGFEFHERYLWVEANLKGALENRGGVNGSTDGISLEMNYNYAVDIYELAYKSFETDRRFHLEQQFDQDRAKYVKESYINWCRDSKMPVFSARKGDELLGYIIFDPNPNKEIGCIQILLGVTRPDIKGKVAAFPLYNGLLSRLSLLGGYMKYCGYISSTNIASINLHQHFGARVMDVMDEYIYRTIK